MLALLALLGMQQRLILSEPVGSLRAWVWTQVRTAQRAQLKIHKIQSLGGNIRGARRGVLRQRLVTARPGRLETPARQALRPGYEELAARIRVMPETEARPREPKIATVERREASVPRHGTQGASQAPGLPRHVQAPRVPRTHPNVSRRFAHPRFGLAKQSCKPWAQTCAAGTRWAV